MTIKLPTATDLIITIGPTGRIGSINTNRWPVESELILETVADRGYSTTRLHTGTATIIVVQVTPARGQGHKIEATHKRVIGWIASMTSDAGVADAIRTIGIRI